MPRRCTVCDHPEVGAINEALAAGHGTIRDIAGRYGLAPSSVQRHKADHLPGHLLEAHAAGEAAKADNLMVELGRLREDARRIGGAAEQAQSYAAAIAAIREQSRLIELLLKVAELALAERTRAGETVLRVCWDDGTDFVRFAPSGAERGGVRRQNGE